jgi:peptidoglycan/xylan/chitin deacetylase (PgdA/CDA1 family)
LTKDKIKNTSLIEPGDHGAFVISLDFEMYWGVRDYLMSNSGYVENLKGEYEAIPAILNVFKEYDVSATWATVGFLFAESFEEISIYKPTRLPQYKDQSLSPYRDSVGQVEVEPSICYSPDLIRMIANTPGQELATHTYSHFYCLEDGQTIDDFRSDIESAVAIAAKFDVKPRSIVFPRNQHNPAYDNVLIENGIICFRGNQNSAIYQFGGNTQSNPLYRIGRLADTYVNVTGLNTYKWPVPVAGQLVNIPASQFLRPVSNANGFYEDRQFSRLAKCLATAAEKNEVFHLWWHPHNFGRRLEENIGFLRRIFDHFGELRLKRGLRSLSMGDLAESCLRGTSWR